jgi:hypothetical protein
MSAERTGAAEPPAAKASAARKFVVLAAIAVPIAVAVPFAVMFFRPAQQDLVESTIREAGFVPVVPPSRLWTPGALYGELGGGFYDKICYDDALAAQKTQKSPTQARTRESLENNGFFFGGDFIGAVNAKLSGARVTAIEYKLSDVAVSQIIGEDLIAIDDVLLRVNSCNRAVTDRLKANKHVCPGYSALSATTSYKVHIDLDVKADAQSKAAALKIVQGEIAANSGGDVQAHSEDEFTGADLFIGIQLYPQCITLDTDTDPSNAPAAFAVGNSTAR